MLWAIKRNLPPPLFSAGCIGQWDLFVSHHWELVLLLLSAGGLLWCLEGSRWQRD